MKNTLLVCAAILLAGPAFAADVASASHPQPMSEEDHPKPPAPPARPPELDPAASVTITIGELQSIVAYQVEQARVQAMGPGAMALMAKIQAQAANHTAGALHAGADIEAPTANQAQATKKE